MSTWAETLETLVRERGGALYGYAYVLTGNRHAADDLLQDALVRAFRYARGNMPIDAAQAYVRRAMQTALIDNHRRASVRPRRDHRGADAMSTDPTTTSDTRNALHEAVLSLPPRERACVVMRYFDGLNATQIAHELNLQPGTVRRYLADGVARLSRTHSEFGLAPDDIDANDDEVVVVVDVKEVWR